MNRVAHNIITAAQRVLELDRDFSADSRDYITEIRGIAPTLARWVIAVRCLGDKWRKRASKLPRGSPERYALGELADQFDYVMEQADFAILEKLVHGRCFNCGRDAAAAEYCFGCQSHVCGACNTSSPIGPHEKWQHLKVKETP